MPYYSHTRELDLGHSLHHLLENSNPHFIQLCIMIQNYRFSISIPSNRFFSTQASIRSNTHSLSDRISSSNKRLQSEWGAWTLNLSIIWLLQKNKKSKNKKENEEAPELSDKYYKKYRSGDQSVKKILKSTCRKEPKW